MTMSESGNAFAGRLSAPVTQRNSIRSAIFPALALLPSCAGQRCGCQSLTRQRCAVNRRLSFSKDYYAGALMVVIGLSAAYAGMSYDIGTLTSMGAGFFPVAVGVLLALVGILIATMAKDLPEPDPHPADAHSRLPDLRGAVCIIAGTLAFIFIGKYGGLLPATFAIVFISALGDRSNTLFRAAALSIVMCAIALVVFSWALKLQLAPFAWG